MPIYEFVCQNCNNNFEKIQSFSNTAVANCPICDSQDVARQMSCPAIHFKGSGWYITDSKKADKQSANGSSENGVENGAGGKSAEKRSPSEGSSESSSEPTGDKASPKESASKGASKTEA